MAVCQNRSLVHDLAHCHCSAIALRTRYDRVVQGEVAHKLAHKVYTHKVRTRCAQGTHKVRTRIRTRSN